MKQMGVLVDFISVNSQCNWQRSLQLFLAKQQSFMPLTHCLELQGAGEIYSENNLLLESNECRDREKLEPHPDLHVSLRS